MADTSSYWEQQKKLLEQEKFNSSIALANSQANAARNTQASLQAQGYGGTGYGAAMQTNVNNAYLSAQAANQNDYWSRLQELNYNANQDLQANASDMLQRITQTAYDENSANPFIESGIFLVGEDGKYAINYNNEYVKNFNDGDLYELGENLKLYNNPVEGGKYRSVDDLYNVKGYDRSNNSNISLGDKDWGVKNELDTYKNMVNNGEIKDGDLVLLSNARIYGHKQGSQVFIYFKNGTYYTMSDEQVKQLYKQNPDISYKLIEGANTKASNSRELKKYFGY